MSGRYEDRVRGQGVCVEGEKADVESAGNGVEDPVQGGAEPPADEAAGETERDVVESARKSGGGVLQFETLVRDGEDSLSGDGRGADAGVLRRSRAQPETHDKAKRSEGGSVRMRGKKIEKGAKNTAEVNAGGTSRLPFRGARG